MPITFAVLYEAPVPMVTLINALPATVLGISTEPGLVTAEYAGAGFP